jgi:Fur family peroxide stress response transcriptional regulator
VLAAQPAYAALRTAGLKLTPQRRAVIDALVGDGSHPTAEEVAARLRVSMPGMSLSTVYKVLHELSDLGLVRSLEVPGAMRFDPAEHDHIHVLCDGCGTIVDVELPAHISRAITAAAEDAATHVRALDVVVRGRCPSCSAA